MTTTETRRCRDCGLSELELTQLNREQHSIMGETPTPISAAILPCGLCEGCFNDRVNG